MYRGLFKKKN